MRFPGSVFLGSLFILGVLCQGLVLAQLSRHPERGHRGPAEAFHGQVVELESAALHLTAAGFKPADFRAW